MIEEINLYESLKFIQLFSNPEKFEIKEKLTEKNERKSPLENNLLAAFWPVRIQNETTEKWTQMHKHARK